MHAFLEEATTETGLGLDMERGTICGMSVLADVDIVASLRTSKEDLVVASLAERVGQPLETFVQTVTRCGASRLDVLWNLSACDQPVMDGSDLPRRVVGGCGDQACR